MTITDATSGATIYYTVNGSTPNTSSAVYSGPISVPINTTIEAMASVSGNAATAKATAIYGILAGAPTATPAPGTYVAAQSVTLSSATPGAMIYYTTNGNPPTSASTFYSGPITVASNETVQAIAVAKNYDTSAVASAQYSITPPAPAPTFSPAPGTYLTTETVTINCSNKSAVVYYTTNGTTPNTSSAVYSGPVTVSGNETILAMALAPGGSDSAVSSGAYAITLPAATPVFSPGGGKYTAVQTVSLSDATAGAAIYYTTDGSTPTAASTPYSSPISVGVTETIKAVALASGGAKSSVGTAVYTVSLPAAAPVFFPASGTYHSGQSVTMSDTTPNAVIYYTTDGLAPKTSSAIYSGPISVSSNTSIQAMALASGGSESPAVTANYVFPAATPYLKPGGGTYVTAQKVTIASKTPGATIYFTTNGTTPTTSSNFYSGAITVSTNQTIRAIAVAKNYNASWPSNATYVITPPAPTPTFFPAAGTYLTTETVTINCANKSAVIYYTTDGSTPTTGSAVYTGPVTVVANETISAMALAAGGTDSAVSSATYTITLPAAAPVFSPGGGKYTAAQTVTLSDATPGATIYYTTNGTTPTAASTPYTGPISVAASENIEAVALASGGALSPTGKADYTITLPTAVPVISPAAGTYNTLQSVTITDATPNAVIYYTVNGTYPTTSSPIYTGPIPATTNTTIQAIAAAPNDSNSAGAEAKYTIVAPAPAVTPTSGTFDYTARVSMSSAIPGATIYYTNDGSTPTTSSPVYTGPITVAPQQTTTEVFQASATANGYLPSASTMTTFTVTLPPGVLARANVSTTPAMTIPPNFMGLSADWRTPSGSMGQASTGVNLTYRTLINNFTQYFTAPLLFRIEGDATTLAEIQADAEPLTEFAEAVNVNYTLGVDLLSNNLSLAEQEAAAWKDGVPNNLIQAIEIGNEPDEYSWANERPSTYAFPDYLLQFQEWQQGIDALTGAGIGTMGPSCAGSPWNAGTEEALAALTMTPTIVSQHAYLAGAGAGSSLPADYLLQPNSATELPANYAPFAAAAHQAGLIFRMGEINSVAGGGAAGISNTFSSALWSIDIMFNYLSSGMDGVNWHSGQYTNYALFEFDPQPVNGLTTFPLTSVNPLYYGLLAFAQMAGRGAKLLPVATMTNSNVSVWATIDNTSTAHLVVINKDEAATGNVQINLPGYTTGTVRYLSAQNYSATNGVTFGGQTFDGSTDGTIQGELTTTTISAKNGTFTLPGMPITTAAVIDFSK